MVADPLHISGLSPDAHEALVLVLRIHPSSEPEAWRPLPTGANEEFGWAAPIYHISSIGRVFWFTHKGPPGLRTGLKALREDRRKGKRPHLKTNLHAAGGGDRTVRVHRLVLATFAGPDSPLTPVGRHKNGDGTDNRLSNLVRGTHSENLLDQYLLGERVPANQYTVPDGDPF